MIPLMRAGSFFYVGEGIRSSGREGDESAVVVVAALAQDSWWLIGDLGSAYDIVPGSTNFFEGQKISSPKFPPKYSPQTLSVPAQNHEVSR